MRDKVIRTEWAEPILVEDAIASPQSKNCGLYYITRLFSTNKTSIYIGKATRTIRERLRTHDCDWVHNYRGEIYIRI